MIYALGKEIKLLDTYRQDVKATLMNQIYRVFAGPVLLLFIPIYLNTIEQGYWYTFTSLAALAVFADLGFTNIILQFAAHEFAFLRFNENGTINGDAEHLGKLSSFFLFSLKWLVKIVMIVFPIIIFGGYCFLSSKNEHINWEGAWIIYSVSSAFTFVNSIILSFFEGCNSVRKVQSIRLILAICNSLCSIFSLYIGLNLYALALSLLLSSIVGQYLIFNNFRIVISQLLNCAKEYYYDWKPQFIALIWRYAISWCSGYLILQTYTPIAFHFYGPEFAGKVGISMAMWTAGFSISTSWLTAVTPRMNMLIAERKWKELDVVFGKSVRKAMFTMVCGGVAFLLVDFIFQNDIKLLKRIVSIDGMIILFLCWLKQLYVNSVAIYLRSHKKEPMVKLSVVSAIYISVSTLLCAMHLKEDFLFLGLLSAGIFGIPYTLYLLKKERKLHYDIDGGI